MSQLPCSDFSVLFVLSRLICPAWAVRPICPGWPVHTDLPDQPVQGGLVRLSRPGCPAQAVLSCPSCPVLAVQTHASCRFPSCHVLVALFLLSRSGQADRVPTDLSVPSLLSLRLAQTDLSQPTCQANLSWRSCSRFPVPAVLSWLSCQSFTVPVVLGAIYA
jgi:hypothetical protein